jgi:methylated-DNA-[protein]-cysteine S-methyltransferase
MQVIYTIESPIGLFTAVEEDGKVVRLILPGIPAPEPCGTPQTDLAAQLGGYFSGDLKGFTVPVKAEGSPFFRAVWQAAQSIPYGGTVTYGELAARAGRPRAIRACGQAMARNPLPLVIPCHRVIYSHGKKQSYLGGEKMKLFLLGLEAKNNSLT